jgi:hypothetical protein
VEGGGFEPPKAPPTDLQSVPFGRSGTPPLYHQKTKVEKQILFLPAASWLLSSYYLELAMGLEPATP